MDLIWSLLVKVDFKCSSKVIFISQSSMYGRNQTDKEAPNWVFHCHQVLCWWIQPLWCFPGILKPLKGEMVMYMDSSESFSRCIISGASLTVM